MNGTLAVFAPNKVLSKNVLKILLLSQAAVFLLIWTTSSFPFLPRLSEIGSSLSYLVSQGLIAELITSLMAYGEAVILAMGFSLLFSYSNVLPFMRLPVRVFKTFRFLSLTGLTFFFTLWTSSAHQLKILILAFSISVFFVTGMIDVIDDIPSVKYDLARTLRMSEWRVVWEVVILGRIDYAFDILRQNAAIGWMMLTMVEALTKSEGGIGSMLYNENKQFHIASVVAIQLVILGTGLLQDYFIGAVKNTCCPYARLLKRK